MTLTIETPALLFSATSLILLAYTNRFLTIASIVRGLKKNYDEEENKSILLEIQNLNLRITLIRYMQLFGVLCLFLSVFAMLLLFFELKLAAIYFFGFSMLALLISLGISFWEISISVNALRVHLSDLVKKIYLSTLASAHSKLLSKAVILFQIQVGVSLASFLQAENRKVLIASNPKK
jgi:hypothetical protein